MTSPDVEVLRVLGLCRNPEGVRPASSVHGEYVDPVLGFLDEFLDTRRNPAEFPVREETFVDRFLPARTVSLEKMAHAVEPFRVRNIIGYKI